MKQQGREVDHLATSSAEVKNEWSCTSAPPLHFCGVDREKIYTFSLFTNTPSALQLGGGQNPHHEIKHAAI